MNRYLAIALGLFLALTASAGTLSVADYGAVGDAVQLYLNSTCTGRQVIITNGTAATFSWSGSQWTQDGWIDTRARVHW